MRLPASRNRWSRMISPSLPCTRKIRRTSDTSNLFRTSSRRRLHDMAQLPMDSRHLHPLWHPRRSIQASTVATPHLNPNTQRTTLNEYPQSPLSSQPLLPQSRLSSLSQPGSESTGTQANLLKSQKRLLTLSSQTFLPSQHKRVHIRRLRQPQPCLRFRTTPLHVPDGVFKLDDCVRLGMWHSGDFKTEVKVREDRGGYCLVVVSIRDRGKKDVVGLGVEVCRGGLLCLGLLPA